MRMIIPRKALFLTKWACRQATCMHKKIMRDISLIFNEFKDAPLWFLCNYYTARIRVIGVNVDQGKRNLVRVSEKFELSKGKWAEKWPKNPREMVLVSSEFKLSEFELHWGSRAVLKYFLEFICNWSVKKIKSHRMKTIIHKMRRVKNDQTSQCFQFIRPFDLIIEDRMSSLQFLLPILLSIKKLKPLLATELEHWKMYIAGGHLLFPLFLISEWY